MNTVLEHNPSFYVCALNITVQTVLGAEYALVNQADKASALIIRKVCLGDRPQTNKKIPK